jgi:hypothetical protein
MAETVEIQKSTGGYMSVDAAAAVERNQQVINNLREAFQQASAGQATGSQQPQPQQQSVPATAEK